jgi:hypothetical protein
MLSCAQLHVGDMGIMCMKSFSFTSVKRESTRYDLKSFTFYFPNPLIRSITFLLLDDRLNCCDSRIVCCQLRLLILTKFQYQTKLVT